MNIVDKLLMLRQRTVRQRITRRQAGFHYMIAYGERFPNAVRL